MTERGRAQRAYARCLDMYDMDCAVGAARAIRRSALISASLRAGELIFFSLLDCTEPDWVYLYANFEAWKAIIYVRGMFLHA